MSTRNGQTRQLTLLLLALVLIATAASIIVGAEIQLRAQSAARSAMATSNAKARAQSLAAALRLLSRQVRSLSQDQELRAVAFVDGNEIVSPPIISGAIADAFPGTIDAKLIPLSPLGVADARFDARRFNSNIEVDLIARAFKGKQPGPEFYLVGDRWQIGLAGVILTDSNKTANGVLLLTLDAGQLLSTLLPTNDGKVLLRTAGKELFRTGTASSGLTSKPVPIAGTSVSLTYSPSSDELEAIDANLVPLVGLFLVAGALLIVGSLVLLIRFHNTLEADVRTLTELATKQRSATASLPVMRTKEIQPLADAILNVVKRIGTAKGATDEEEGRTRPQAKINSTSEMSPLNPLAVGIEENESELDDDSIELELDEPLEIPDEIFRAYDIRGTAESLSDELVLVIGRAIASIATESESAAFVVGADARDSSPRIREFLVKGLLESGSDVIDIGTVPTPLLYFAAQHLQTQNAVMITGSHHGPEYNGIKIMLDGQAVSSETIQAIKKACRNEEFREEQGSYRVSDINADYIQAVCDDIVTNGSPRVVIDCANGAAGVIAAELFEALGARVTPLFDDLDGHFPNHAPDPSVPENLRHLIAAVKENQADLGIAFDGDADRIGVIDGNGRILAADRLLMLFARDVLSRHPGADVVFDVKCSRNLARVITEAGGRPIMWHSGHALIKRKMREVQAMLGGEYTGHICFADRWLGFDDALYCGARLIEIISLEERSLADIVDELPRATSTSEILLPIPESEKFSTLAEIIASVSFADAKLITIDGLRAEFDDGWALIRASNTSAAFTLRFEAENSAALERIKRDFREQLAKVIEPDRLDF